MTTQTTKQMVDKWTDTIIRLSGRKHIIWKLDQKSFWLGIAVANITIILLRMLHVGF